MLCVVYLILLPLKSFDISNITGVLPGRRRCADGHGHRPDPPVGLAVPVSALAALVLDAPLPVVCLGIYSGKPVQDAPGASTACAAASGSTTSPGGCVMSLFCCPVCGAPLTRDECLPLSQPAQLRHRPGGLHLPAAPQPKALRRPRRRQRAWRRPAGFPSKSITAPC